MGKRIRLYPLDDDLGRRQLPLGRHPRKKTWIDIQVLVGVPEHNDACSGWSRSHANIDYVAQLRRRAVVIQHAQPFYVIRGRHGVAAAARAVPLYGGCSTLPRNLASTSPSTAACRARVIAVHKNLLYPTSPKNDGRSIAAPSSAQDNQIVYAADSSLPMLRGSDAW